MNKHNSIEKLFNARSIAIIGASNDLSKIGGRPIHYLQTQRFKGEIYPINPKYKEIAGLKVYKSILEVPKDVDVAIVSLPVRSLRQAIKDCTEKNVKTAVIFTAGLAEVGEEGVKLQKELVEIANSNNMYLVGPNCFGVANLLNGTIGSFAETFAIPIPITGTTGFVSQSGGIGLNLLNHALNEGIGFNYWATTGNESDLEFVDFLAYMLEQPDVKVVGGYIEALKDGKKFTSAAKRALELRKPLVLLKVGTTEAGQKAVMSHTGSLAGADTIYETAFRQSGVIRVKDKTELLDTLKLFQNRKKCKGNRVGIVTASGGNGIMITDCAIDSGLEVPSTSPGTKKKLLEKLPPFGSANNPIDVTAQVNNNKELFKECIELVINDEEFDSIVICSTRLHEFLENAIDAITKSDKLICLISSESSHQTKEMAIKNGIPCFDDISRCVKAISNVVKFENNYKDYIADKTATECSDTIIFPSIKLPNFCGVVSEWEAKKILSNVISIPKGGLVFTEEEAVETAKKIGFPVVMKINSSKIAHKSDLGGVKVNLQNEHDIKNAFKEINKNVFSVLPDTKFEGMLIEEFVFDKGIEVVVGFNKDSLFGHVLTFGLGGVFVEVLRDVSMRVLPINQQEVIKLMEEIKGWAILEGYRENISYDIEALSNMIMKLITLVNQYGHRIEELEINPIKVLPKGQGVKALDALLRLE
ncbi:acetate--CoA ligase family protein [Bacillus dakarensis]|uniref:acetate--CoA ligase family protein n=1 Tax=Robertmurraya dakarensis TaxID=1926278 RepID=UPI000980EED8|nr:acetate--CoA ligase family protein [Bacillus dakarensis]